MTADEKIQALGRRVDELTNQLGLVQDELAIRRLQHAYSYFIDKCLYDEAVDLFRARRNVLSRRRVQGQGGRAAALWRAAAREIFAGEKWADARLAARAPDDAGHHSCSAGPAQRESAVPRVHAGRQPRKRAANHRAFLGRRRHENTYFREDDVWKSACSITTRSSTRRTIRAGAA